MEDKDKTKQELPVDKEVSPGMGNYVVPKLIQLKKQLSEIISLKDDIINTDTNNFEYKELIIACGEVKSKIEKICDYENINYKENVTIQIAGNVLGEDSLDTDNVVNKINNGRCMILRPLLKSELSNTRSIDTMYNTVHTEDATTSKSREIDRSNKNTSNKNIERAPKTDDRSNVILPRDESKIEKYNLNLETDIEKHRLPKICVEPKKPSKVARHKTERNIEIDCLKDQITKLEVMTSSFNEDIRSSRIKSFLTVCEKFKRTLDEFKTYKTNIYDNSVFERLVKQIAKIQSNSEAKLMDVIPKEMEDFIIFCENVILMKRESLGAVPRSDLDKKILTILISYFENIISYISRYKNMGMISKNVELFYRKCISIRRKLLRPVGFSQNTNPVLSPYVYNLDKIDKKAEPQTTAEFAPCSSCQPAVNRNAPDPKICNACCDGDDVKPVEVATTSRRTRVTIKEPPKETNVSDQYKSSSIDSIETDLNLEKRNEPLKEKYKPSTNAMLDKSQQVNNAPATVQDDSIKEEHIELTNDPSNDDKLELSKDTIDEGPKVTIMDAPKDTSTELTEEIINEPLKINEPPKDKTNEPLQITEPLESTINEPTNDKESTDLKPKQISNNIDNRVRLSSEEIEEKYKEYITELRKKSRDFISQESGKREAIKENYTDNENYKNIINTMKETTRTKRDSRQGKLSQGEDNTTEVNNNDSEKPQTSTDKKKPKNDKNPPNNQFHIQLTIVVPKFTLQKKDQDSISGSSVTEERIRRPYFPRKTIYIRQEDENNRWARKNTLLDAEKSITSGLNELEANAKDSGSSVLPECCVSPPVTDLDKEPVICTTSKAVMDTEACITRYRQLSPSGSCESAKLDPAQKEESKISLEINNQHNRQMKSTVKMSKVSENSQTETTAKLPQKPLRQPHVEIIANPNMKIIKSSSSEHMSSSKDSSKLGFFRKFTKNIVKVNRYMKKDGTVSEEKQTVRVERVKFVPGLIGVADIDIDSDVDVDLSLDHVTSSITEGTAVCASTSTNSCQVKDKANP